MKINMMNLFGLKSCAIWLFLILAPCFIYISWVYVRRAMVRSSEIATFASGLIMTWRENDMEMVLMSSLSKSFDSTYYEIHDLGQYFLVMVRSPGCRNQQIKETHQTTPHRRQMKFFPTTNKTNTPNNTTSMTNESLPQNICILYICTSAMFVVARIIYHL